MKLAVTLHPYYPESWLSKTQAAALLTEQGYPGVHVTGAWCQAKHIEVSSTGHIRLISLELVISRMKSEVE